MSYVGFLWILQYLWDPDQQPQKSFSEQLFDLTKSLHSKALLNNSELETSWTRLN